MSTTDKNTQIQSLKCTILRLSKENAELREKNNNHCAFETLSNDLFARTQVWIASGYQDNLKPKEYA